jgi:hypothetical protein
VVRKIGAVIGVIEDKRLDLLGILLCRIAEVYLTIADETGLELKDGNRANWIDKKIIGPASESNASRIVERGFAGSFAN